ncbi:MAG: hypothetical protein JRF72_04960, partial [Deltaproteobacteria bacterium]|nr:hypothetical protein [Deltaproteobacteria bacterium]
INEIKNEKNKALQQVIRAQEETIEAKEKYDRLLMDAELQLGVRSEKVEQR